MSKYYEYTVTFTVTERYTAIVTAQDEEDAIESILGDPASWDEPCGEPHIDDIEILDKEFVGAH